MSQSAKILITVVLTAAVAGGGVYMWQQSEIDDLTESTSALEQENMELLSDLETLQDDLDEAEAELEALQDEDRTSSSKSSESDEETENEPQVQE